MSGFVVTISGIKKTLYHSPLLVSTQLQYTVGKGQKKKNGMFETLMKSIRV